MNPPPRTPRNECYPHSVPRNGGGIGSQSGKFKEGFRRGSEDRGTPDRYGVPLTPGDFRFFLAVGSPTTSMGPPALSIPQFRVGLSRQGMPIPITLNVIPVNDNGPPEAMQVPGKDGGG